jgi:hypothetical protein
MNRLTIRAAACASLVCVWASWASAGTVYDFFKLTSNSSSDVGSQLQMTVDDVALMPTKVSFRFDNLGPLASSITGIYFDDGALLGIASINEGPGVQFTQGGSPPNLPAGNTASPPFVTTAGFLADSDPPVQPNGVNPGEWVEIIFNLKLGKTVADVNTALAMGGVDGGLRVGLHVQAQPDGQSDSYLNNFAVVPLPAAAWMGMSLLGGVGGVGFFRRRRLIEA